MTVKDFIYNLKSEKFEKDQDNLVKEDILDQLEKGNFSREMILQEEDLKSSVLDKGSFKQVLNEALVSWS